MKTDLLDQLAKEHDVWVSGDSAFQRRVRLLQALWREAEGLKPGLHRGSVLGSRLSMPEARQTLCNYLTPTIREVVRAEVLDPIRSSDKLYGQPRIFNDLLSSQPMCFNLFAELQQDLELASRMFQRRCPGRIAQVTAILFEHSPGRGDPRFTGDRSAFDVFVEYSSPNGASGFVGIEVKYHENLKDTAAEHRARYDEVAARMQAFKSDQLPLLHKQPLQQIWRDHLLAGSMLQTDTGFTDGLFVFLYPRDNGQCAAAVQRYSECLANTDTFAAWTLETLADDLRAVGAGKWLDAFTDRYLGFDKLDDGH